MLIGINDVIIDPGFAFSKTLSTKITNLMQKLDLFQNYRKNLF